MPKKNSQRKRSKDGATVRMRDTKVKGKTYTYWTVDFGIVDGKRETKQFRTEGEADREATRWRKERRDYGQSAFQLSNDQRLDAVEALAILSGSKPLQDEELYPDT